MTVIDSSAIVDFLLGTGVAYQVEELMAEEGELAAPDLLVFEVVAALRRNALRDGGPFARRATAAVDDLSDLRVALFPALAVIRRAWDLRENVTTGDALFVALAEQLDEPLATKDGRLASAAREHAEISVVHLE